jgi:asparagine synthase (glutamine-hydrolysing)
MSAIAGVYSLDGRSADPAVLRRMGDAMAHRGPDCGAQWSSGAVGMTWRRMLTTPQSRLERQPLHDESGDLCLVLDGRIDNRVELSAEVLSAGIRLRDDTDAELILGAYRAWGPEFARRIVGEFAFALWDNARAEMLCARDALGERPLFYSFDGRSFAFASEIQPLFVQPGAEVAPNLTAFAVCLTDYCSYGAETFYKGVFRLLPGHLLVANADGVRTRRYWDLDPGREVRYRDDADYAEHFAALFKQSVDCRLHSDPPVGALLSGGLDSSSIVCTARRLCSSSLEVFSLLLPGQLEEHARVRALSAEFGLEAVSLDYRPTRCYDDIDRYRLYPDSFFAPTALMFAPLYRAIKERGITVVLDGTGGDELLATGLSHLTDLFGAGRFRKLAAQLRYDADYLSVPMRRLFVNLCVKPFVPPSVANMFRRLAAPLRPEPMKPLVRSPLSEAAHGSERPNSKFRSRADQSLYEEIMSGWNFTILREAMDVFSARFGLEMRRPFLDRRLVEFIFAIPDDQRWRDDQPRYVLRNAMRGVVPDAIRLNKRKVLFDSIADRELRAPAVRKLLEHSALVEIGVLDGDALRQRVERFCEGRGGGAAIGLIVALDLYCRQILAGPAQQPVDSYPFGSAVDAPADDSEARQQ